MRLRPWRHPRLFLLPLRLKNRKIANPERVPIAMADVTVDANHDLRDVVTVEARAEVMAVATAVAVAVERTVVLSVVANAHLALTVQVKTSRVSVWMQTATRCPLSGLPVAATRNAATAQPPSAARTVR